MMGLLQWFKDICTPHPERFSSAEFSGAEMLSPTQAPVMEAARFADADDIRWDRELEQANRKRKELGRPPLTSRQAYMAASTPASQDPGFDVVGFLIGYETGIAWPSGGGMLGMMLHESGHTTHDPVSNWDDPMLSAAPTPSNDPQPNMPEPPAQPDPSPVSDPGYKTDLPYVPDAPYVSPDPSPSYDSSSSYDSGSSGGGGGDGS